MTKKMVIMLIDDNKIDLFIHGEAVKCIPEAGTIMQHSFAGDALTFLSENSREAWPDIILLDIHMPIINGFEFMERYEKLPGSSRTGCKVIIVSSTLDAEDLKKARSNPEVFAFLEKPLNTEKLKTLLVSTT